MVDALSIIELGSQESKEFADLLTEAAATLEMLCYDDKS